MPYAEGRIYNDADSHIMETKDWLFQYADPKVRPKLAPIDFAMCGGTALLAFRSLPEGESWSNGRLLAGNLGR